jgi:hypothetical protein
LKSLSRLTAYFHDAGAAPMALPNGHPSIGSLAAQADCECKFHIRTAVINTNPEELSRVSNPPNYLIVTKTPWTQVAPEDCGWGWHITRFEEKRRAED